MRRLIRSRIFNGCWMSILPSAVAQRSMTATRAFLFLIAIAVRLASGQTDESEASTADMSLQNMTVDDLFVLLAGAPRDLSSDGEWHSHFEAILTELIRRGGDDCSRR